MLRYYCVLVCLLLCSFSQGQRKIDSLRQLIYSTGVPKDLCLLDQQIFAEYFNNNQYDSTIIYWSQINASDCKIQNKDLVDMMYKVSIAYSEYAEYERALAMSTQAERINERDKDSIYYLDQKSQLLFHSARLYGLNGNEESCVEYYLKTIQTLETAKDSISLANAWNNIGIAYYTLGDKDKSNQAYQTSIRINRAIGNDGEVARTLKNQAGLLLEEGILGRALEYLQIADSIEGPTIDKYLLFGDYYLIQEEPDKAIYNYELAKDMCLDYPDKQWLGFAYTKMAKAYKLLNKPKKQIQTLTEAQQIYERLNLRTQQRDVYLSIYHFHKDKNDFKSALNYHELYSDIRDSLYQENKQSTVNMLNTMYQMTRVENENALLKSEQISQKNKQRNQNVIFGLIALMTLLIAGTIYRAYQQKQQYNQSLKAEVARQTKALKQSNEELERFVFIASHDLKEPLRNIVSYLTLMRRRGKGQFSDDIKDYMNFAIDSGKHMYKLIGDILEHSRISQQEIEFEVVNLKELMPNVLEQIQPQLDAKNAEVIFGDLPTVYGRLSGYKQIFQNLIENGLKYNEAEHPKVKISSSKENGYYKIFFQDNGIGIEPQYYDRIFEMFKRLHSKGKYKGTGLGLPICKKLIEKYGGHIEVASIVGHGSTFIISLPMENLQQTKN